MTLRINHIRNRITLNANQQTLITKEQARFDNSQYMEQGIYQDKSKQS